MRNAALGFLELGVERGDTVAILGDNRPEWLITELAAQSIGAVSMGVYQDAVTSEVQFLIAWSDAVLVMAEDQEQVDKILESRAQLPRVRKVLFHDPRGLRAYDDPLLMDLAEVEKLGARRAAANHGEFEALVEATRPDDTAILSTTSGTTGKPKLAMLTHRNLLSMAQSFCTVEPLAAGDEFLSFLPLPWIGEQMIGVACGLLKGFAVNFPEEPETAQIDLREIGPHMMFSPPRIWENMVSDVQVRIEDSSRLKRAIYGWSIRKGEQAADLRMAKRPLPARLALESRIAGLVCFLWIKDKLGLRRLKRAYTGGAALGPDIFRFFHAMGVNLKQIYGQTEVSGISVLHSDGDVKFQTVGVPVPGTEITHRRQRRDPHQEPGGLRRLLQEPRGHRRDAGGRLAALGRRRLPRRRRPPDRDRPRQGRDDASRRHQVQPAVHREQAEVQPLRPRGGGVRRRLAVRHRAGRRSTSRTRASGRRSASSRTRPSPTCRRRPRSTRWCAITSPASTPTCRRRRGSSASCCCTRSSTPTTPS